MTNDEKTRLAALATEFSGRRGEPGSLTNDVQFLIGIAARSDSAASAAAASEKRGGFVEAAIAERIAQAGRPMDVDTISSGLETMAALFRYWDEYNVAARAREGLTTDPDTHLIAVPPEWPRHGTLRRWRDLMENAALLIATIPDHRGRA